MDAWNCQDEDGFDYLDFFQNIMKLFRGEDGDDLTNDLWVKETISWWNT